MERAIGTTFKVGIDELIVKEVEEALCIDEHGIKCYFFETCLNQPQCTNKAGHCINLFRKDGKDVIFIKK